MAATGIYIDYIWPMGIYNLNCTGHETTLQECQYTTDYSGQGCYQYNDASVICIHK